MIKTLLTEKLGIQYPIVQGGMQWVGLPVMAAAVSNAGGLGILSSLTQPNVEALRKAIRECRALIKGDKPFGVNITMTMMVNSPDFVAYARAAVEEGVRVFETAGNTPKDLMKLLKDNNCIIIHKCTTIRHAKAAERMGVDFISIDGSESAGTNGEQGLGSIIFLARAAQEMKIPYIASGGFGDGRGLAAALSLGAQGVNMGTRFMCTVEAPVHPNIKKTMVESTEQDTILVFTTLGNTSRVFKNAITKEVVRLEKRPGGADFERDLRPLVRGPRGKQVYETGDIDAGMWTSGVAVGLVQDIPTCAELLQRFVREAEEVIDGLVGAKGGVETVKPVKAKL
ncbi:inosine monophosphate dehydrogenase [Clavulina sp. PMI_390]|nr:inosine monophosphate dehydrogenase [Clavulina sp. PMI_390]